jgi:hypothetical protein
MNQHGIRNCVGSDSVTLGGGDSMHFWLLIGSILLSSSASASASAQTPFMEAAAVPGILPSGFGESVDRDIARARAATARFKVAAEAIAAGYVAPTNCIANPREGGMGLHYKKEALRDATLDPEHPEIVLYQKLPDGTLELTGVEFIVPIPAWTRSEPPTVMQQPMIRDDTLGIFYLHAWIWKPNASGLFANWNPLVKC